MMRLAAMLWLIVGTALAGVGVIVVVATPALFDQGMKLIPIVAGTGFLVSMPISYAIAKKIAAANAARA